MTKTDHPSPCHLPGKRERTRLALVEAAVEVLAEKGLEGTSIDELMRAAGMARGTFYNYFQNREEVACAVSETIRERIHYAVVDRIPEHYSPAEIVSCVTYGFIHYGLTYPKTGWALVRIGGSSHWVTGELFQRPRIALTSLLPDNEPLKLGLLYIEGVTLMALRRLLENVITIKEADSVLGLALRGIGIEATHVPRLLAIARAFVTELQLR